MAQTAGEEGSKVTPCIWGGRNEGILERSKIQKKVHTPLLYIAPLLMSLWTRRGPGGRGGEQRWGVRGGEAKALCRKGLSGYLREA